MIFIKIIIIMKLLKKKIFILLKNGIIRYSFDIVDPNYRLKQQYMTKFDYNKPRILFIAGPTGAGKSGFVL